MGLLARLIRSGLARWLDIGHFATATIIEVETASVRVLLVPPGRGYRLTALTGVAGDVDRLGVRPPPGWTRVDEGVAGAPEARFDPGG